MPKTLRSASGVLLDCSRCNAEAVVKRGSAAYCAKCALARDWEDIIAIVQEDRVDMGADVVEISIADKAGSGSDSKEPAAVAAESNGSAGSDDLPADPFA